MEARSATVAVSLGALLIGAPFAAPAQETPKNGGVLNYVIPADAPPSFDAHREPPLPRYNRRRRSTVC